MFELIKFFRIRVGYDEFSAETFDRLIYSRHVRDLRSIARAAIYAAMAAMIVIALIAYKARGLQGADREFYDALVPFQISAVLVTVGGIIAWCYQTGSARLGTVDLFACEIATLCRIWTVDTVVSKCTDAYELDVDKKQIDLEKIRKLRERFSHFESVEKYTPVFDANAKELRNLDVKVLTNMTAFYTYWKAANDARRSLASVKETTTGPRERHDIDDWHGEMRHLIYMQFLTCESARKAIRDLIEFQPNNAENTITILLSELRAYGFLRRNFASRDPTEEKSYADRYSQPAQAAGDVRRERLELRLPRYKEVVVKLYNDVQTSPEAYKDRKNSPYSRQADRDELLRDWEKARGMLAELDQCFFEAIGEHILKRAV